MRPVRFAGISVPGTLQVRFALPHVFGIGVSLARQILKDANVADPTPAWRLGRCQVERINAIIDRHYVVEGELKQQQHQNIERLKAIRCYRGIRHRRGLPVRGQRTHTNARTKKGPRRAIAGKKKVTK